MARIPDTIRDLINNALAEGVPCLLGTVSADGQPNISPKGSVLVHGDDTLAYWERSKRGALRNVQERPRVVVYYRNPAKAEQLPRGAAVRFYGSATVHADGPERDAVMAKVIEQELKADPERQGAAVVIKVDRITDLRGEDL